MQLSTSCGSEPTSEAPFAIFSESVNSRVYPGQITHSCGHGWTRLSLMQTVGVTLSTSHRDVDIGKHNRCRYRIFYLYTVVRETQTRGHGMDGAGRQKNSLKKEKS